MTVMITRLGQDASELRLAAAHSADAKVARRLLALALVLEGRSRAEAAQSCGMDRQTLRDWVHRYNEHGIAGLSDQPHGGGQAPKLTPQEQQEVARWVRRGPDPKEDGLVRWRLADLKRRIFESVIAHHQRPLSMAARNSPESSGRNSPLHSDLVTAKSPWRSDIGEAVEVEIDDFQKRLGGGAVAQAFGQSVGPGGILGL